MNKLTKDHEKRLQEIAAELDSASQKLDEAVDDMNCELSTQRDKVTEKLAARGIPSEPEL